jgi:hypothetical protein
MIANVSLQIAFIGGQGLDKPVERLQNALSSNFFANTEMYDERSTITSNINGKSADDFTKEFLAVFNTRTNTVPKSNADSAGAKKGAEGKYIGNLSNRISYNPSLLYPLYEGTKSYFDLYDKTYNELVKVYGEMTTSLFFSDAYRKINTFTGVTETESETYSINLLGEYQTATDLSYYTRGFKVAMVSAIKSNNMTELLNIDNVLAPSLYSNSEKLLQQYMVNFIETFIDGMMDKESIKNLEKNRQSITSILDSLNFITENEVDGKMEGTTFTELPLNGFTNEAFYKEYKPIVNFINENHSKLTDKIDNSLDFNSTSIDLATLKKLLSVFLQGETKNIVDLYKQDTKNFPEKITNKINKNIESFIEKPSAVKFKYGKVPTYDVNKKVDFEFGTPTTTVTYDTAVLSKIFNFQNKLGDTLNYYKK